MKYISCGHASIDKVIRVDGTHAGTFLGGPGVFGYTGIRLYTDDVAPMLNVADDFYDYYGEWVKTNKVDTSALTTVYDETHTAVLRYQENGVYETVIAPENTWLSRSFEYAWSNVRADQIDRHTDDCKGLYIFMEPTYKRFWKDLAKLSEEKGFEVMWELGLNESYEGQSEYVLDCLKILKPQMSSMNHVEATYFFKAKDQEEIFEKIHALNIPYFFYRAGSKGSYSLVGGKSYFVPSIDIDCKPPVDATGCGNTSTAASTYAWINTRNPVMTAILANIAAGFNILKKGLIDDFSKDTRKKAIEIAAENYVKYIEQNPGYVSEGYSADPYEVLKNVLIDCDIKI